MLKKILLSLAMVAFSLTASVHAQSAKERGSNTTRASDIKKAAPVSTEEEDGDCISEDGMLQAIEQNARETRDPHTGKVPYNKAFSAVTQILQNGNMRNGGLAAKIKWTERGPSNGGGRTRAILVDPNDPTHQTVWAGSVSGGLWRTTNINASKPNWQPVNEHFANLAVSCITYDPKHPQVMYFGTGEGWYLGSDGVQGNGIFRSLDGGKTWNQLASTASDSNFNFIQKIVVDAKKGFVYACSYRGLFRTNDSGKTWKCVLNSNKGSIIDGAADFDIDANDSLYVAMGMMRYPLSDGIYKSFSGDSGTWVRKNTSSSGFPTTGFQRIAISASRTQPGLMYAMAQSSATRGLLGVYKSIDGGNNWTTLSNPVDADPYMTEMTRGQAFYDLIIRINPLHPDTVFIGGVDMFKTVNGGTSWTQVSHWQGAYGYQYMHSDMHAVEFAPNQSDTVYFGNDGGIFQSVANGNNIQSKDSNYRAIQFYGGDINPIAGSNELLAGCQDNGTHRLGAAGMNPVDNVTGGDGMIAHIDQQQAAVQFASYVYTSYYLSRDSGKSFGLMFNQYGGLFVNPTDYSSLDGVYYGGYNTVDNIKSIYKPALFVWNNPRSGGLSWGTDTVPYGGTVSSFVTAVTASPSLHHRVYVGTDNGRIWVVDSTVSSVSLYHDITGAKMPKATVKWIAVDPADTNRIIVTFSNYGVSHVWYTTTGGKSWHLMDGNLPDVPVRCALFDPNYKSKALLATEIGVFATDSMRDSTSTIWALCDNGLPFVRTDMLKLRPSDNIVAVFTHGRGAFSTDYFAHEPCSFVRQSIVDTIIGGKAVVINGKSYSLPGHYRDTAYHKATHCDSVIFDINTFFATGVSNINGRPGLFRIYPNPTHTGSFTLLLKDGLLSNTAHVQLINTLGQAVNEWTLSVSNGQIKQNLQTEGLPNGLYIIKISTKNKVYSTTVVLSH